MSLRLTSLALLAAPVLGLLAGCQPPPQRIATGAGRGDAAAAAYCRQRAEEIYETQNRSARLRSENRDSPFSGAYMPSTPTRTLSEQYARDSMIADCIRNNANREAGPDLGGAATTPSGSAQPGAGTPAAARPASRSASPGDLRPVAQPGSPAPVSLERAPPPPRP